MKFAIVYFFRFFLIASILTPVASADTEVSPEAPPMPQQEEKLLTEIVRQNVSSLARDAVQKEVQEEVNKRIQYSLSRQNALYLNRALAAYSLALGVDAYKKADSEQSRYFVATNMLADILMLIPATTVVGEYIKMSLAGQMLATSYFSKEAMKKILFIYIQVEQVQKEILDRRFKRASAEYEFLAGIWNHGLSALSLAVQTSELMAASCQDEAVRSDFKVAFRCYIQARQGAFFQRMASRLLIQLLNFETEMIDKEKFFEAIKADQKLIKALATELESANNQSEELLDKIENAMLILEDERFEGNLDRKLRDRKETLRCLKTSREVAVPTFAEVSQFNLKDPVDRAFVQQTVSNAIKEFESNCRGVVISPKTSLRTKIHLKEVARKLQTLEIQLQDQARKLPASIAVGR